jgi:hypothetical protein
LRLRGSALPPLCVPGCALLRRRLRRRESELEWSTEHLLLRLGLRGETPDITMRETVVIMRPRLIRVVMPVNGVMVMVRMRPGERRLNRQ